MSRLSTVNVIYHKQEQYSVKNGLTESVKSINAYQPAQFVQSDISRNCLIFVYCHACPLTILEHDSFRFLDRTGLFSRMRISMRSFMVDFMYHRVATCFSLPELVSILH